MKINNSPPKNPKDKAKLFTIENEYINKLKSIDSRVQNNYKGQRLYYKSDLEVGEGINYYVPLSSAKESQKKITNKSVFKLYGDKAQEDFLGVLHINNLIPVPGQYAKIWSPLAKTDERYLTLVIKQARYIKAHEEEINKDCKLMVDSNMGTLDPVYFSKNRKDIMTYKRITSDLTKLEQVSKAERNTSDSVRHRSNDIEIN
ncbi:type III toxin-antitoxin system ToxN/AbiQ family toxin [Enterococcus faecium]|uniref:type III toxin-antitoxin system ToxN/AbiQ family toxin n=1 Tax=Enterococcus faecium TaxID=1352 RepID=UPI001E2BBA50|nr:type III toxin-antitoxin system ToxN/AbiQ family toxin [Enterococcus faecium]